MICSIKKLSSLREIKNSLLEKNELTRIGNSQNCPNNVRKILIARNWQLISFFKYSPVPFHFYLNQTFFYRD